MGELPTFGILDPFLKTFMPSLESEVPIETSHWLPGPENAFEGRTLKYSSTPAPPATVAATSSGSSGSHKGEKLCSIPGCNQPLLSRYHRKYKICEDHVMSPAVTINGIPLRFCQKCGRFHDLAGFDGLKRSCRQSLDAHNKRRRAKSAQSSRDKSWREEPSPKQPRKAPSKRAKEEPTLEANITGIDALPTGWLDINLCLSEIEGMLGNPLPMPSDVLKAVPSYQGGTSIPGGSLRSDFESQYQTGYSEHTLALKFHGGSPSDLPKDMLMDVQRNLSINPMDAFCEGSVRPGCTHVSLRIRIQEGEEADKLRSLETESLAKALSKTWRNETTALSKGMEVQWAGSRTHVGSDGSSFTVRALPEISVFPSVVQCGMRVEVEVVMDNIDLHGMSVAAFCRQNGKYLTTMIVPEDLDNFLEGSVQEDSESADEVEGLEAVEGLESLEAVEGLEGFDVRQMMARSRADNVDLILEDDGASCGAASSKIISGRASITSDETIERCGSDFIQESRKRVRVIGLVPGSFEMELMIDNVLTAPASLLALPTSDDVADARRLLLHATRVEATAFVRDAGMVVRHAFSPESLLPSDLPMIQHLAVKTCEWAMERRSSHLVRILQEALPAGNACCGEIPNNAPGAEMSGGIDDNFVDMTYPPDSKMLSSTLCETYELEAERAIVQELCREISQLRVDEKSTLVEANGWKNVVVQIVVGATLVILASSI